MKILAGWKRSLLMLALCAASVGAHADDQLAKVKDWLMKLRPQVTSFSEQNQGLVSALVNEDAIITPERASWPASRCTGT